MKTLMTIVTIMLLLCGLGNTLYAKSNPLVKMADSSVSGTFDKYSSLQYDGRTVDIRVIWEMERGEIRKVLGGASGDSLFSTRDDCNLEGSIIYLTSYLHDLKNEKKIVVTGYVDTETNEANFELIDHGEGTWPWFWE